MRYLLPAILLLCGCFLFEQSNGTPQDMANEAKVEQVVDITSQILGLVGGPIGQGAGGLLTAGLGVWLGWRRRNLTLKSVIGSIEAARSSLPPEVQAQVFSEISKKMPPKVKEVVRVVKDSL